MRLEVETGSYRSARDLCAASNHDLTGAVSTLNDILFGCAAMAGDDWGGQQWAASYDGAATDMVQAGADLAGSLGAVAALLDASRANHEGADHSARISGPPGRLVEPGDTRLAGGAASGAERLYPGRLPSAAGGSGGGPPGWHWLAGHLHGYVWPDADTHALRAAGAAWQQGAGALTSIGWSVDAARVVIQCECSPEVGPATQVCTQLKAHCDDLSLAYANVGQACSGYADQVDDHHHEILIIVEELMAWTVVDQVTGAVLSFFTAGASEVAAQLVESGIMARYAARVVSVLEKLIELARTAAQLIRSRVTEVLEILGRLKRLLGAKVLIALDRVASTETKNALAQIRELLASSERGAGHTLERHVGMSEAALAERIAMSTKMRLKTASSFADKATAVREIGKVIESERSKIAAWLSGSLPRIELEAQSGRVIGRTLHAGFPVRDSTGLRVVLERDPASPTGYVILTAFPK